MFIESEQEFWFHGSPKAFDSFDYSFLGTGKGYDQEGPGFYFTSQDADMAQYGGNRYKVRLNLRKLVPLKGRPNRAHIRKLMEMAPDLTDTLTNWDENPRRAFEMAFQAMLQNESPHQAFQSVWYDFYRGKEADYLKNMVALGYDGVIVPKADNVVHAVVFSPDAIEIIERP